MSQYCYQKAIHRVNHPAEWHLSLGPWIQDQNGVAILTPECFSVPALTPVMQAEKTILILFKYTRISTSCQ